MMMLLYVHRNHKDGEPRMATSTFTQLLRLNFFALLFIPDRSLLQAASTDLLQG